MNKLQTIFKAIGFSAVVFIMAQGCIPNAPVGGNPTSSNQFNINISDAGLSTYDEVEKILLIDGDSIKFNLRLGFIGGGGMGGVGAEYFSIRTRVSSGTFEFLTDNNSRLITLAANINVPSGLDTNYTWKNSQLYPIDASGFIYPNAFNSGYQIMGSSFAPLQRYFPEIPPDVDRFFIFRKLKGTNYQYYWTKIKFTNYGYSFNILSGRYQMNSIITGQ